MDTETKTVSDTALAHAPEPYSAEWWAERTTSELRDIIKHGFRLGEAYDGAVVETERRAHEAVRRLREEESATQKRNSKMRLIVLGVIFALILVIGLIELFLG